MGFYDEIYDSSAGPDVLKHLVNGKWQCSSSGALTSIGNPSKGGTAYRVQGARWVDGAAAARVAAEARARAGAAASLRSVVPVCVVAADARAASGCTKEEVDAAYAGAHAAQKEWAATPLHKRCTFLHKVAAIMRENREPMARCLVNEIAKPAKDAMAEVVRAPRRSEQRVPRPAPAAKPRTARFAALWHLPAPEACRTRSCARCAPQTSLTTRLRRACAS